MANPKRQTILIDFIPVSEFQRQIVVGVARFCREHLGYRHRTLSTEVNLVSDAGEIDGVIAIVPTADPHHSSTRFGKPVVNISTIAYPVPFPTVTIDNRAVGKMAAQHLIAQGYRSFGYHMESSVYFSRERGAGFIETLDQAGYGCSIFDTSTQADSRPAALNGSTTKWLTELPKPLGLFTHNDARASILVDLCRDARLSVPEEVGVIGVDNDPLLAHLAAPGLSSIDPGAAMIGYRAAETLVRLLRAGEPPAPCVLLPPKGLVERESTEHSRFGDPRVSAAVRFIRRHATLPVGVDDVVEAAGCSRRSLERLFRTNLGHTPAEEIRRVQVNHAKWLLVESDRSLTQVSERCGYQSFRNFATAFRREVGISASTYRKKMRSA